MPATRKQLGDAIRAAVSAPFEVFDASGASVATGTVGGAAVKLPPGTYRVVVLSDPEVIVRRHRGRVRGLGHPDPADRRGPTGPSPGAGTRLHRRPKRVHAARRLSPAALRIGAAGTGLRSLRRRSVIPRAVRGPLSAGIAQPSMSGGWMPSWVRIVAMWVRCSRPWSMAWTRMIQAGTGTGTPSAHDLHHARLGGASRRVR